MGDGDISGILTAVMLSIIAVAVLVSAVTSISNNYGVTEDEGIQRLNNTITNSSSETGAWVQSGAEHVTDNDWVGSALWLTSGSFAIVGSMMALPGTVYNIVEAMLYTVSGMPVGLSTDSGTGRIIVDTVSTLIMATFLFAGLYALLKVKL